LTLDFLEETKSKSRNYIRLIFSFLLGSAFCTEFGSCIIRETEMSDRDYNDLLIKLRKKIEYSYDHFLQWQNWRRIKPIMIPKEVGIKLIKMQYANNDLILLKLIPSKQAGQDKDKDKATLIFRKRKFAFRYDDTSKYTKADNALLRVSCFGLGNSNFLSFDSFPK
jgi:hypothetical protein